MPGIFLRGEEPIELMLRKFKKQIENAGVMADVRKGESYEKPSVRRKRKAAAARKRAAKRIRRMGA
ncbi:30S ribosomal protein S21 [Pseudobacteriovorax antillogorgiicola]|uniref:Small ribosomal subunit protein bS21 n=1 Tax=Pseudobacteriovorax antillogorgiicola TaxID=1513793 RepID=A0A1Y6B6T5_9BACT|nr:30S ribosomal protein S21 [Pseudobacteriovorax antillogorgiicola]TCS58726.1 SSU ribosomal protein S21P [Pseudobacteriovorax antillogorgiicola]SME95334.1 SSU ribosomal protein S21P [Pseudobacteriovorax antillogorgiicola]